MSYSSNLTREGVVQSNFLSCQSFTEKRDYTMLQHTPNIYYRDEVVEGGRLSLFFRDMQALLLAFIAVVNLNFISLPSFLPHNNFAHLHNSWVTIVVRTHAHTHKRNTNYIVLYVWCKQSICVRFQYHVCMFWINNIIIL